jgi:pentatricopeptide repeat protein
MTTSSSASAGLGAYVAQQLFQAFSDVQTELVFFLLAVISHAILMGKLKFLRPKSQQKPKEIAVEQNYRDDTSSVKALTGILAQIFKSVMRTQGNQGTLIRRFQSELRACSPEEMRESFVALFASLGKSATPLLAGAVKRIVATHNMELDAKLGARLLQCYFDAKVTSEFEECWKELEQKGIMDSSILLLGFRSALHADNFKASLSRFQALQSLYREQDTPSAAPHMLLDKLVKLSADSGALHELFVAFKDLGLEAKVFDAVLVQSANSGDFETLRDAERSGRSQGLKLSSTAYQALIKAAGSPESASPLFLEAAKGDMIDTGVVAAIMQVATAHHDVKLAETVLRNIPAQAPAGVAGLLLRFFAEHPSQQHDRNNVILELFSERFATADLSSDVIAQQLVVDAAIKEKRTEILKVLMAAVSSNWARIALIKTLSTQKQMPQAFAVFRACEEKTSCMFNALLDACINSGTTKDVAQVMQEAQESGMADIVSYNTYMKAQLKSGKTGEVQKVMASMRSAGLQPNQVTFNELLDAAISTNIESAWSVLDEMQACSVKPNSVTCSILLKGIQGASSNSYLEKVIQILDNVDGAMDEVLLSSMIEACLRSGRADLLASLLKKQRSSKHVTVTGPHTYGSIIRAYGFVKDVGGAWYAWKEMQKQNIVPTSITLGCMVETLVTNGDIEAGYQLIHDMLRDSKTQSLVNAVMYGSILKGFAHEKMFKRVWEVYEEMKAQKLQFSKVTFNTLIDACARSGELNRIASLLEEMDAQAVKASIVTYSAILKGYCQADRLDEAFKLVEDMRRTTEFKPDEIMFNTLLDGCARKGLYDRGMSTLKQMDEAGVRPSNFTLSVLVKLANRGKKLDKAFELVDEITNKYGFRANVHVFANLVQACVNHRDLPRALRVLERMIQDRVRPDIRTYSLLIRAFVDARQPVEAAGLVRAAMGMRGPHPCLAKFAAGALQPQSALPGELISETLLGISGPCREQRLASALLNDLSRLPGMKLDPKLKLTVAARVADP